MRCFIALDLPEEIISEIKEIQEKLKKRVLFNGKFTESNNLHLTLKFFGEIDEEKLFEIRKRLRKINFNEIEASLGEVGVFSKDFVRIIWIKLNGKGIYELQKRIDEELKDLFKEEERFMGHITLARVKSVGNKKGLFDYLESVKASNRKFKINEFSLKKSELHSHGPEYEDIEIYREGNNN